MFYVDRCQQWLWSDLGLPGRNLLHRRGLSDEVLRANRVGYDPGPGHLPRRSGLPRGGPAIVLPVLDDQAESRYVQARYLTPVGDRRYDNPTEQLVGPSPRVGFPRPISVDVDPGKALICEGVFDALSATQAGYTTAAYLSASAPDEQTARTLLDRFGDRHLLLLFDDNDAGRAGAERLRGLLTEYGAGDRVSSVVPQHGDLNQWLQNAGEKFPAELRTAIDVATRNVYRVAVLQQSFVEAHPAGGESPAARYQHVHTFELPVEPVRHNVAHGPFNGEPRDPAVEAAELVCDITDRDPENLLPPFDDLARGWHQGDHGRVHPGDVLIVSAPNGTTTTLECTRWGWDRLDVPPAVPTADLPAAAPSIGANLRLTL